MKSFQLYVIKFRLKFVADETTDVSRVEQFSICIRYFDADVNKIREDFFTICTST